MNGVGIQREMIAGVVLAGGPGRRMGADKPLCLLAGRTLAAHVAAALRPQVAVLAVNANGDPGRYEGPCPGLPVLADPEPDAGPLAGVLAGLRWAAQALPGCRWLMTAPADTPFLPGDLVARLAEVAGPRTLVACAASAGRRHPIVALWRPEVAGMLAAYLAGGDRKANLLLERLPAGAVAEAAFDAVAGLDPFMNVNTPTELALAESLADRRQ